MLTQGVTPVDYGGVTVLRADDGGGRYPGGNSMVVRGRAATLLVDPSLALPGGPDALAADAIVVSHAHEDHLVGVGASALPVHVHRADLAAVRSFETLLAGYGLPGEVEAGFSETLVSTFHVGGRPDAAAVEDGHVFDLGGRTATVVHLPGHTAGHCGLLVEPDGFLFVADIDLTSFGPYYGDIGSSLEDFERSIRACAEIDARWYATFHQKGVIDGPAEFRERLRGYLGVIEARDAALLAFLDEPRTLDDIVEHRFVYRPHVDEPYVETVESRTAAQHLDRLVRSGAATEAEPGLFRSRG